jgi:hypothetical protein
VDETDRRASGNDLAENARHRVARFDVEKAARPLIADVILCVRVSTEPWTSMTGRSNP